MCIRDRGSLDRLHPIKDAKSKGHYKAGRNVVDIIPENEKQNEAYNRKRQSNLVVAVHLAEIKISRLIFQPGQNHQHRQNN